MKKLFLLPLLALSVLVVSCNDPKEPEKPGGGGGQYGDYPYSSLTPEQQKEKLAAEANALLNKVSGLPDEEALKVIESLSELPEPDPEQMNIDFSKGNLWVADFKGEYTWNARTYDWDFKNADGKIVLNFPSTKGGSSNDAQIVLTGVGTGRQDVIEGEKVELPKKLNAVISKNGKKTASIEINAENPNADKIADSASASAEIGKYKITAEAKNNGKNEISSAVKFSKGSDVIIDGSFGSTMDWQYIQQYKDYVGGYWDEEKQEWISRYETISDTLIIVDYQTFTIKIGSDLAVEGHVDIKKLNQELEAIDQKYSFSSEYSEKNEKRYDEELAAVYNKYITGYLISRDDKTKIARIKYDVYKEDDTYELRELLVFGDNTEVSFDAYFGEGFKEVIEAWEDFFERLGMYSYDEPSAFEPEYENN